MASIWRRLFGARPSAVPLAEVKRSFEEAAADEEHFPSTIDPRIQHVRVILQRLGNAPRLCVLDAGCGKGRFARVLVETNPTWTVVGLDLAEAMLRHVRAPLHPVSGTLTALPFPDHTFDAAYATESLEHALDVERAVAELCRVVKPGGDIVVIDKNAAHWGRLKTPEWERWFDQKELTRQLGRHCREVESEPISYWDDVEPDGLFLLWLARR